MTNNELNAETLNQLRGNGIFKEMLGIRKNTTDARIAKILANLTDAQRAAIMTMCEESPKMTGTVRDPAHYREMLAARDRYHNAMGAFYGKAPIVIERPEF